MGLRVAAVVAIVTLAMAGCAKPPQSQSSLSHYQATDAVVTHSIGPQATIASANQPMPAALKVGLAGRTVTVLQSGLIALRPKEVVLTFDDGPRPGKTDAILDTLATFGVKATFLMLGSAAERNPELVRMVAEQGHTVGTHTYDHVDLTTLSNGAALAEIYAGQQAVAAALAPLHASPSRFFRFPYLADTNLIRTSAIDNRFIILDVDIDSKDYYSDAPAVVLDRTLERLEAQGSGVILFHDIHERTVAVLPNLLHELKARGYSVVTLRSSGGSVFDEPLVTAAVPDAQ